MAKYKLGDIAPIKQGAAIDEYPCWLLNLDMVESTTGRIIEYLYVQSDEIGSSTVAFDTNNVLYSKLRPYLNKVVLPDRSGYATSEMLPLMPDKMIITREYLTYFLRSPRFVGYINEKTSGAKMPRANTADLKSVEIDCPPIERQKEITGILERLSRIIDLYQQQLCTYDTLIKARFVEMFGDDQERQDGVPLEDVSELVTVGIANAATHAYADNGVLMFRNLNIKENKLDDSDLIFIHPEFAEKYASKTLRKDDILVTRTGYPGVACLVPEKYAGAQTFTTLIVRIMKDNGLLPSYVCYYINSPFGKRYVRQNQAGVAQQNFGATALGKMPIVIPSLKLQQSFVHFADQVDKSKAVIQTALERAQILFDSLMQKYFG